MALGGCSSKSIDTTNASRELTQRIRAAAAPATVGDVDCPAKVDVRKGSRFSCKVEVGGQPVEILVEQVDDKGTISAKTDKAIVNTAKVQADLLAQFEAAYHDTPDRKAGDVTVECPGDQVRVLAVKASFICTANTPGGPVTERVVVTDTAGHVTYQSVS